MKDSVTKFDFDDAFKALDEIEIPKAPKGIKANREDLHETMKRVDKFELLFEDFYDVNDSEDMNAASEEREAEVAKAKLARIEKIVDLDAESEEDILPSYVGKTIIQCPQCMMLFYKDAEDISKDEENPDLVNIGEVCQHCGNDSGYDIIGKVAEETEEVPADDFNGEETTTEETSNGENDLSIEGEATSEEGEVDELSAEADLDELDLDLEEEPAEEEEEIKEESLNTSELLKKIEDKNDLKTENESEKLTLNEDIEDNLDDALKDHEEYIEYLRAMIKQEEEALSKATNEQVKKAIQKRIDAFREDLEAALPDAVKAEAQEEELPDAEEAGMEDATDNTVEDAEETTESLHEGKFGKLEAPSEDLSFLANEFDKALEAAHDLKYDIEIKDGYIISVTSFNIKQVDDIAKECFAKHDIVPVITTVSEFVHDYKLAPQDKVAEPAQESLHNSETQEEAEEQSDLKTENESKNLTLNEAAGNNISDADFNELINSREFKEPISPEEVENYFENFNQASEEADKESSDEADIEISVEGDTEPVSLETADSEKEPLTEGPIKWAANLVSKAKNKAAAKVKAKSDATATQKLATIIKHFGFKNFYIIPYADTRATARFLADNKEFYSPKENYYKDKKRFMINANTGGRDFPEHIKLDIGDITALSVDEIASKVNNSFIKAKDNLQALSNTEATSFIDLLGSKSLATVPRGKEFEEDVKGIKLAYIEIVGVKGELPQAGESMSEADSKALMGQSKNIYWLYKFENGKGELNADLLNAASSASETGTGDNDAFSDPSYKKGIETKISAFKKIAMIKLVSEGQVNFVEVDDATIDNYEELRTKCLQNSSTTDETYYMMVLSPELEDISTDGDDEIIKEVPKEVVTNLVTEKFTQGKAKLWTKFTGKVPETTKPKTDDEGKEKPGEEKPTGDADSKEKPTDDVDKEKKGEAPSAPANMTEPKSNEDYAFYIEQFKAAKKKLALVTIGSDGTVLCKDDPDEATTDNLKELRELLKAYPTFLGCDNGIIVVDLTFTKSDKPVEVDCDKFCIERITKDDKISTNYSNVAKAIGVKTSKIEKHFGLIDDEDDDAEVMDYAESLKVTDIDEKSFNEKLTESLIEVYSNVDSFTMTNCTLEESILTVTGDIKFTSGKVKTTHYIFEAVQNVDEIILTGKNQTLFESGEIKVTCRILAETLQAGTLTYKYNIGQKLVEGLILNK